MQNQMNWERRILGAALIVTGLACGAMQQLRGGTTVVKRFAEPAPNVVYAAAQEMPKLENANVTSREIKSSLAEEVNRWASSATKAQWLGYTVPAILGDLTLCCGNTNRAGEWCGPCHLEEHNSGMKVTSSTQIHDTVQLEGPREIAVLYRAEAGKIGKIRVVSEACTVDAGGFAVTWLTGVKPSESVALLEKFVHGSELDAGREERTSRGALMAIAFHADPAAVPVLESFVALNEKESLRKESAFWLGQARGTEGLRVLQKMAKNDPSTEVRKHVTFALSVSKESAALDEMIRMAHEDKSGEVRGQALFWLAQKAGQKASSTITGAIDNDPDTEVKKKAVFALSQMPADEGVPKLIAVAQSNRNPEVRKQAMFWLGQSEDSRALAFFEKVLAK